MSDPLATVTDLDDYRCGLGVVAAEVPWAVIAGCIGFAAAFGFGFTVAAITVYQTLRKRDATPTGVRAA